MNRLFFLVLLLACWLGTMGTTNVIHFKETYWIYEIQSEEGVWQDTTGVLSIDVQPQEILWFTMEGNAETDSIVVLPSVALKNIKNPGSKDWDKPPSFILRPGRAIGLKPLQRWGWTRLTLVKSSSQALMIRVAYRIRTRP